ncbi:MAG: hypothetical protein IH991_09360, partial [Planctomycetes bacterium]|nr:hypothetical protein [Planctomycetota bacterium]
MKPLGLRLYLSIVLLVSGLHSAAIQAADPPFVFRDVAKETGLREPLAGIMAHAAAWGDVNGDGGVDPLDALWVL